MNATNVHMNAEGRRLMPFLVRRRLPAWAGVGMVLGGLFASTSSAVAGVSFWSALPAAQAAVFLNFLFMLPLLYGGIVRNGHESFRRALLVIGPPVLVAQIPAGVLNTVMIEYVFPYMMLSSWWTTFAMLTGTAFFMCLLGLPLTLHYEQIRGDLFSRGENAETAAAVFEESPKGEKVGTGLWIPEESGRRLVRFEDILYLTSRGHSTIIHTDARDYKRAVLMKRLGTGLPSDAFMRVHKSHMINLKRVDRMEYFMGGAYIAFLNDEAETEVPVGRTYAAALKTTLGF